MYQVYQFWFITIYQETLLLITRLLIEYLLILSNQEIKLWLGYKVNNKLFHQINHKMIILQTYFWQICKTQESKFKLILILKSGTVLILIRLNVIKDQIQPNFLCRLVSKFKIFLFKFKIHRSKVQKYTLGVCHKHWVKMEFCKLKMPLFLWIKTHHVKLFGEWISLKEFLWYLNLEFKFSAVILIN